MKRDLLIGSLLAVFSFLGFPLIILLGYIKTIHMDNEKTTFTKDGFKLSYLKHPIKTLLNSQSAVLFEQGMTILPFYIPVIIPAWVLYKTYQFIGYRFEIIFTILVVTITFGMFFTIHGYIIGRLQKQTLLKYTILSSSTILLLGLNVYFIFFLPVIWYMLILSFSAPKYEPRLLKK